MKPVINILETGLNGAVRRQRALADNIANVDTPGYKRRDVNFTAVLKKQLEGRSGLKLKTTDDAHIGHNQGETGVKKDFELVTENDGKYRNDNNNVDIDVEMAELAKNQIYYNTLVQQVNNRFKLLKDVIDKGGR